MPEIKGLVRPPLEAVTVRDSFWTPILDKIYSVTVKDVIKKFEECGAIENFRTVAAGKGGKHIGPPFFDGLVYELMRGMSDFLYWKTEDKPDPEIDAKLDEFIALIKSAQDTDPDGYIGTNTTLTCPQQRWGENGGDLIQQHDLYNAGALVEAAVHHYRATGKTTLLACAVKLANYMSDYMGKPPKKNIVPAHPLPEEAFIKLYRLFKEKGTALTEKMGARPSAYLELAECWLDFRGVHTNRASCPKYLSEYVQDQRPLVEQSEAVGHAVRATLLYTGLTAGAIETGRGDFLAAARRLWDNVTQTKMHISGGVGTNHATEAFSYQYQLPNGAYLETCAGVGLAFWAGEMHRALGSGSYMDVFERVLYNNILVSLSEDGTKYFYQNPLRSDGSIERWNWHGCPCCPPMLLKIMGCLKTYIYSLSGDTVYINMNIGSELRTAEYTIKQDKGMIRVFPVKPMNLNVKIRIPEYAGSYSLTLNGRPVTNACEDGYVTVSGKWTGGEEIEIKTEYPIKRMQAHPYVIDDAGLTAVQKGPFLYCAEGIDNGGNVDFTISADAPLKCGEGDTVTGLTSDGKPFTLVPYYRWNNRGKGTMAIWLRQDGMKSDRLNLSGWVNKLYRVYKYN